MSLSLEELEAKYRAERDRRLRSDGNNQYRELSGEYAEFDQDPYADPNFKRDPIVEETDVAIIGAGFGGMAAGVGLIKRGVKSFRIIDKAADFGGTWYWNRYPGAACDVESYIYMPYLEETGYIPSEKYAKAPEIFAHCQRIGRHFDLYPRAMFQTEVQDVRWDEAKRRWQVITDRGDHLSARFVITAGGVLHKAKLPGIPGVESYKGKSFHTTHWDYSYTGGGPLEPMTKLHDKRVAIIGTGCTGIQAVPKLANDAEHVYVFQRTPSAIGVRANQPTDPEWAKSLKPGWQKERMENFTRIVTGLGAEQDLVQDGWTGIFGKNPRANNVVTPDDKRLDFEHMEGIRARVEEIVQDKQTAEALKPWYFTMCKRPTFHDEYLPSFNRPNVTLVDTSSQGGVERITEKGVVANGVEYPVDCIIYASGFETGTSYASRMGFEITGKGGVTLTDAWKDGPGTLFGIHARGFPNLLMYSITQGGFAVNFVHVLVELGEHTGWLIRYCLDHGIETLEPTHEAQEMWFGEVISNFNMEVGAFLAECTPGYYNAEGSRETSPARVRGLPYYGGTLKFFGVLRGWREAGGLEGLEVQRQGVPAE
jgi:cation diffusion facilitator CzcD-associated flavoprotein CzcO